MAKFDKNLQSHKEIHACLRCFFLFFSFHFCGLFFREQSMCTAFSSGVAPKVQCNYGLPEYMAQKHGW